MADNDAVWIDVLPSMRNFFPSLSRGANDAAEKAGVSSGGHFLKGFGGMSKKLAGTLGIAFGAASFGAVATGLVNVGKTFEQTSNSITKKTGATGAALDDMMNATKGVAMKSGASIQTIGDAVAGVHQRLNLTGKPLQDLSGQVLRLSQVTGIDLNTTLEASTRMFGDWSIKSRDQSKALDELYKASSVTGVGVDKLSQSVVQYGAPLRQLGYSYEQSLAMIGKWNKEGVNSQLVLGGMRKALSAMAKAGDDPKKAFPALIKQVQSMSSASKAGQLAAKYFGSKAGPDMAAAIREGRFSIADLTKQISNSDGALTKSAKSTATLSGKWGIFKNQVSVLAEPAAKALLDALTKLGVEASSKLTPAMQKLNQGWKDGTGPAGQLKDTLKDLNKQWADGTGVVGGAKDALSGLGVVLKNTAEFAMRHKQATELLVGVLGSLALASKVASIAEGQYRAGVILGSKAVKVYVGVRSMLKNSFAGAKWLIENRQMIAHAVASRTVTAATKTLSGAKRVLNGLIGAGRWVAERVAMVAHAAATRAHTVSVWAGTVATRARNAAVRGAGWVRDMALMAAHKGAQLASAAASRVLAIGQRLVNAAMRANPIGIVITLLMLLAAGLVYAWKHSETFRRIVMGAWHGVQSAARAVWNWLKPNVIDKMALFFGTVLPNAFRSFGRVFGAIWNGIKAAAAKPVNFVIKTVWNDGLRKALNLIPGVNLKEAKLVPGFRRGGWTGDGREDDPAGVVHGREYVMDAATTARAGGRVGMDRIRGMLNAGVWPVGAAGEAMGGNQNSAVPLSIPSALSRVLPVDLRRVVGRGPGAGARGVGGPAGQAAVQWGMGRIGSEGWYRRCLAFVNQAWGSRVAGLMHATARQSMNSVPRRMDGTPPPGAAVYWDTGGSAGHVALSVGDGTELSNDIVTPGMISRVPAADFAQKWHAKYMGWYSPDGSQPGADSSWLAKLGSFIGSAASGVGDMFSGLLSSITGKISAIKDKALAGLRSPWGKLLTGIPGWAVGKATSWVKSKIDSLMSASPGSGGSVERWRPVIAQALKLTGIGGGRADEDAWLRQVQSESSGNPNEVQSSSVYDVNIARGDPARGLGQIPKVTWDAFGQGMGPFIPNVYNPLKNLIVAMRDASRSYHNWRAVIGHGHGYLGGTGSAAPGMAWLAENGMAELITSPQVRMLRGGERVYNSAQTRRLLGGGSGASTLIVKDVDDQLVGRMRVEGYSQALDAIDDNDARIARVGA